MDIIEIKTLVDITNTKVARPNQGSQLAYDQNRNFITLRQCMELRSIVSYDHPPSVGKINIETLGFGSQYRGTQAVWTFSFIPDRAGVYQSEDGDPVGYLLEDIDGVPVIINLTETINITRAIFSCKDPQNKNTIIQARQGTI
jgi:hypothetical protein